MHAAEQPSRPFIQLHAIFTFSSRCNMHKSSLLQPHYSVCGGASSSSQSSCMSTLAEGCRYFSKTACRSSQEIRCATSFAEKVSCQPFQQKESREYMILIVRAAGRSAGESYASKILLALKRASTSTVPLSSMPVAAVAMNCDRVSAKRRAAKSRPPSAKHSPG